MSQCRLGWCKVNHVALKTTLKNTYFHFTHAEPKAQRGQVSQAVGTWYNLGAWLQNTCTLMVKVQGPCQDRCPLIRSSVVQFSASFQIPPPSSFFTQLFFFHGYAGDLEKAGIQLCSRLPSPICGLQEPQPPPNHHSFFQGQSYGPQERFVPPE